MVLMTGRSSESGLILLTGQVARGSVGCRCSQSTSEAVTCDVPTFSVNPNARRPDILHLRLWQFQ